MIVVGVVVVAAATAGGAVAGARAGDREGNAVESVRAKRDMLRKIASSAGDAEKEAARLTPVVAALVKKRDQLEAENKAALEQLRAHAQVDCGNEHATFAPANASDVGVDLAEALRGDFPCVAVEGGDVQDEPRVSVDVVDFGRFDGGACDQAKIVRITLTCSYTEFFQNCAGEFDECSRFRPPPTTYRWDDSWGCIASTPGGHEVMADSNNCAGLDASGATDVDDESVEVKRTAHLYWALRGAQAIYLAESSRGWAELSAAEVAPGVQHADELKAVFRVDTAVSIPTGELPDDFTLGGDLVADGDERTDVNTADGGEDIANDKAVNDGDGVWRRVTVDGRARTYHENVERSRDFSRARASAGVVIGGEHVCARTEMTVADTTAKETRLVKVGSVDGADLFHDGPPTPGRPLEAVLWVSPFDALWRCHNRAASPIPNSVDEEPWTLEATDADRETLPWCFR